MNTCDSRPWVLMDELPLRNTATVVLIAFTLSAGATKANVRR